VRQLQPVSHEHPSSVRTRCLRAGAVLAALAASGAIAACGSSSKSSSATTGSTSAAASASVAPPLTVTAGTAIPAATVRFGMQPFADNTIYTIGIRKGFFKDVGITVTPQPLGEVTQPEDVVPRLLNNQTDINSAYAPGLIQTMTRTPGLRMIAFADTSLSQNILAAPSTHAKGVDDFMKQGQSFAQAMRSTMAQLKGKRVTLDQTGQLRAYYNVAFQLGGISFGDAKIQPLADTKQVELAKAGKVDFASPGGNAQQIELMNLGFKSVIGAADLVKYLPAGDPRADNTIGEAGLAAMDSYYKAHKDTVLRFVSVMFRTIDALETDPKGAISLQLPFLQSAAGVSVNVNDLADIYKRLDPFIPFNQQTSFWTDTTSPYYYESLYGAQIKAAQAGGVLPKGASISADQLLNADVYRTLASLKVQYDALKAKGNVKNASIAAKAQSLYDDYDYLDAVRFLKAATGT
jgi:ABC-type nitrate/sulfonate/bicarbonate transport system substrate-binding protein